MRRFTGILILPIRETISGVFDPLLMKRNVSLPAVFLPLAVAVAVTWFITVPVHELLHAAGCIMSGGNVTELTIQPLYGGRLFERLFPFVRAGGSYAGQLSHFDTGGSDIGYFVTVLFPYALTVIFGLPMLALAIRTGRTVPHAIGIVHMFLPLVSVTGDYYEMGSIVATRLAGLPSGGREARLIRGDDLVLVVERVAASDMAEGFFLVGFSLLLALLLIWATWWCSWACARLLARKPLENGTSAE